MDIRSLKYFLSLYHEGSFTAAAKANYITQPAISIQLRKLQEELGVKLYERRGGKISFTEAGMVVLEYSEKFLNLRKELLDHVKDLRGLKKGLLSIGTIDAAAIYILPEVFNRFKEKYPGIEINLEIASTAPLISTLEEGGLDAVCGTLPVQPERGLRIFKIFAEKMIFIAPPDHPLSGSDRLGAEELSGYPFISFQAQSVTRKIIENALRDKGVTVDVSMAIDSQDAIKHLVSSGLGLSALPRKTVEDEIESGELCELEVENVDLTREIGLILPEGRYVPATVRAFLSVMKEILGVDIPRRYCLSEGGK